MKKLKGLSLILCICVILSALNFSAYADVNEITAYITISNSGEIVKDKNGNFVAEAPVTLTGKESYTLDDVFREAHELYYEGGAIEGYASGDSEWGLSVTKVWGDTSGKFGYQMNLGAVDVWGPTQAVNDGDYVDLCVYENYYPKTESYATFDAYKRNVEDDKAELILYESYYGDNWETLFRPCGGATIFVDGVETSIITDENGKCTVSFDSDGNYLISAKKTKILNQGTPEEETIKAITAPVQIVSVSLPDELAVMHNAVKKLINGNLSEEDQLRWLLADIAGYYKLYPNTKNVISNEEKQECIDKLIAVADELPSASNFAGVIIGLSAIGCDLDDLYNSQNEKVDVVGQLSDLIDATSDSVTNIYTLPYVIIAMRDYATEVQMNKLVNSALNQKDGEYGWMNSSWGVDGATPMLCALAPYADTNADVKNAISEAVELVKSKQSDSGAVQCLDWGTGDWIDSTASTGLAVAGLSAVGINPETVSKNGKTLIDGLMSYTNNELDGFLYGSFDNEQALRGLIAWQLAKPFKTEVVVRHSGISSRSAATSQSDDDDQNKTVSVTVKVMVHDGDKCNNSYTYKSNSSKYSALAEKTLEMEKGQSVYDATVKALEESGIEFEDRNGYIASIGDFSEFDHGKNSGWMFLVNRKHKNAGSKDIKLEKKTTILWFYTDDYTLESGSENYQKPSEAQNNVDNKEKEEKPQSRTFEKDTFSDVKESDWHYGAVKFVYENNLMSGTDNGFEPDSKMTRAMLVSVLFRLSGEEMPETDIVFGDVEDGKWYKDSILWAASVGIVSGVGDNNFAPDTEITREQMAVILYNFAMYKNQTDAKARSEKISEFEDFKEVSDYAQDAISWANAEGFISGESDSTLNPKNSATRAQIASLLMRYCEALEK